MVLIDYSGLMFLQLSIMLIQPAHDVHTMLRGARIGPLFSIHKVDTINGACILGSSRDFSTAILGLPRPLVRLRHGHERGHLLSWHLLSLVRVD